MSIIKALKKIENEGLLSFHVPGHKNGRLLNKLPEAVNPGYFDTTEIEGTDNLHGPEAAIKLAQEAAAQFYGAKESFFLVNGTTGGNIAMIFAAFQPGDKVLICRDAHKSVFTGMMLAQVEPIYVSPEIDTTLGVPMGLSSKQVKAAFDKHNDLRGVVLTYPSYHGICSPIEEIEKIVHESGALLLVDAAHGAHLNLSEDLPISAIRAKADIVVHSTHKSLPSFTQSSMLHYCSERVSIERLRMALTMFQSSSPSYLLMASLENAVAVSKESGREKMADLLGWLQEFQLALESRTSFIVLKEDMLTKEYRLDPTKITIVSRQAGISGGQLEERLRNEFAIQCEYGTDTMGLFISSIATSKEDLDRLLEALVYISQEITQAQSGGNMETHYDFKSFDLACLISSSQANYMDRIRVDLRSAIGYPAGDFIVPYPPGIPIVVPGEVISEQVVNFIEEGIRKSYNINGVYKENKLQVNIIKKVTK